MSPQILVPFDRQPATLPPKHRLCSFAFQVKQRRRVKINHKYRASDAVYQT